MSIEQKLDEIIRLLKKDEHVPACNHPKLQNQSISINGPYSLLCPDCGVVVNFGYDQVIS